MSAQRQLGVDRPPAPPDVDDEGTGGRNRSESLRRALRILDHLADPRVPVEGLTLAELAAALGMNKSTVHRLLEPLCEAALVQRDDDRRVRLGPQTAVLGRAYQDRLRLPSLAHGVLHRVMVDTGETVHLAVRDAVSIVYVDKVESPQPVQMSSRIGMRHPVYSTACGKAMLAFSGDDLLNQVVAEGLRRRTANTLTTRTALVRELDTIRRSGYAVDNAEDEEHLRCVGAPVFDHSGAVVAGVSISGLATRFPDSRIATLGHVAAEAAREISAKLGAPASREQPVR